MGVSSPAAWHDAAHYTCNSVPIEWENKTPKPHGQQLQFITQSILKCKTISGLQVALHQCGLPYLGHFDLFISWHGAKKGLVEERPRRTFLLLWPYMKRKNTCTGLVLKVQRNCVTTQSKTSLPEEEEAAENTGFLYICLCSPCAGSHYCPSAGHPSCLGWTSLYSSE